MQKIYKLIHPYLKPWGGHHGALTAAFITICYLIYAPIALYAACFAVGWYMSREHRSWEYSGQMEWWDWATPLIIAILFYGWQSF